MASSENNFNSSKIDKINTIELFEEEYRIQAIRNAIIEGNESGRALDFDPEKHLLNLYENFSRNK